MTTPAVVTATPHGFQFLCPFCGRVVVDNGMYAETACVHEFEVFLLGASRFAIFVEPVLQRLAA